jgi:hypothetical protein
LQFRKTPAHPSSRPTHVIERFEPQPELARDRRDVLGEVVRAHAPAQPDRRQNRDGAAEPVGQGIDTATGEVFHVVNDGKPASLGSVAKDKK